MAKKQLIMEKALELFARQGIEATTVQQITEHSGISKGAFYLSFKSKDELVLGLVDHFMMQMTADFDHLVKTTKDSSELLYKFFYASFAGFQKHSDFAKILVKEQGHSFNEDFIVKMRYYDSLTERAILSMVEQVYGDIVKDIKYDLLYCIKGFMRIYSELFLFHNIPMDLDTLAKSLMEKTDLLAKQSTIPFISEELVVMLKQPFEKEEISREQLIDLIEQKLEDTDNTIVNESLLLLKDDLLSPKYSPAIIKGLIENIRNESHCKWLAYLLGNHYKL